MTSLGTYECAAEIYSSEGTNLTSRLNGELSVTTSSSVCKFVDLRIENSGYYILTVSVEATYSTYSYTQTKSSSGFTVTSSIQSVSITQREDIDQYKDYSYVVTVLGENGYGFLDGFDLTITANDSSTIGGLTDLTGIYASTKTLTLYFTTHGYIEITVQVEQTNDASSASTEQSFYSNPAYVEIDSISVIQN